MQHIPFSRRALPGIMLLVGTSAVALGGSLCWHTFTAESCCAYPGSGYVAQRSCPISANCPDQISVNTTPYQYALEWLGDGKDDKTNDPDGECTFDQWGCDEETGICVFVRTRTTYCISSHASGWNCPNP